MGSLPQLRQPWRVPRAHLDDAPPAVLRFSNGQQLEASLQVVSLTGGLLSVSRTVDQGLRVKLLFLTRTGPVLGGAEMLPPVSNTLQPFRFVSIAADDQRRLGSLIWERTSQNKYDEIWIQKLRAATAQVEARPGRFTLAGAYALLTLGLATAAYLLHPGLLN